MFRSFFPAGTAWGQFSQRPEGETYTATLTVAWGEPLLQALQLPIQIASAVSVTWNGEATEASVSPDGEIRFTAPRTVYSNQAVSMQAMEHRMK